MDYEIQVYQTFGSIIALAVFILFVGDRRFMRWAHYKLGGTPQRKKSAHS